MATLLQFDKMCRCFRLITKDILFVVSGKLRLRAARIFTTFLVFGWGVLLQAQPPVRPLSPSLARVVANGKQRLADSTDLLVQMMPGRQPPPAWRRLYHYADAGILQVRVAAADLRQLALQPGLVFADLARQAKEEVTTGALDITLNRVNAAQAAFPAIDGSGINLSIKEQRFDTSDIDYRGRYFLSGLESSSAATHAALMATIAAGAGNSSPQALGAAPAARITGSSFARLLPDPDSVFRSLNLALQNHSYGTVVENFYGLEALAYDQQVHGFPALLHVFSAGNSGTATGAGPYAGVAGRGNLTGNFKYAKNVLVVGALDSFARVSPLSSRGPAFDGRVRPELMAFGEDGSSGAAALTSGTAALLQQQYRQRHGQLPPAALLRAVLVNSAFDVGLPGVDHQSGWGALDALAALHTVAQQRYAILEVEAGGQKSIEVVVPAGIARFKATLCWTDPPAAVNTTKALVRNMDLAVQHLPSGTGWQPMVLAAGGDALDRPAQMGIDTVNTTEQVVIDNPVPGKYLIRVDGRFGTGATQEVSLAWQLDTAAVFRFTNPVGGNGFEAGSRQLVRWHTSMQGSGRLEYSTGGDEWLPVVAATPLASGVAAWQVPDVAAPVLLRMVLPGGAMVVSDSFVVARRIRPAIGYRCGDSVLVQWNAPNAGTVQVYRLGGRVMEPIETVNTQQAIFYAPGGRGVFSVAPLVNGRAGLRSNALDASGTGVGCYFSGFFVAGFNAAELRMRGELATRYNLAGVRLQKRVGAGWRDLSVQRPPQLSYEFADTALIAGTNLYRLAATLQNGQEVYSELLSYFHFDALPVQAYPNPVRQGTNLLLQTALPGKYEVQIYDYYGRRLRWIRLDNETTNLQVQWQPGLYLLRIRSDEGTTGVLKVMVW